MITLKIIETDELSKKIENMYTSASPLEKEIYGNLIKMINEMSIDDSTTKGFVLRRTRSPRFHSENLLSSYPESQIPKCIFCEYSYIKNEEHALYCTRVFDYEAKCQSEKRVPPENCCNRYCRIMPEEWREPIEQLKERDEYLREYRNNQSKIE